MFQKGNDQNFRDALEGIRRKTLCHGEKSLMTEFRIEQGAVVPRHSHPHEQTGYLVSGRLQLCVGNEIFTAEPGDSWCIPGGVEHDARALTYTVAIEVFVPRREDYLE